MAPMTRQGMALEDASEEDDIEWLPGPPSTKKQRTEATENSNVSNKQEKVGSSAGEEAPTIGAGASQELQELPNVQGTDASSDSAEEGKEEEVGWMRLFGSVRD